MGYWGRAFPSQNITVKITTEREHVVISILLTFIIHDKTLNLIHYQNKTPKGGKPDPRGANAPPLKETLLFIIIVNIY